jgi:hypothetical protein
MKLSKQKRDALIKLVAGFLSGLVAVFLGVNGF